MSKGSSSSLRLPTSSLLRKRCISSWARTTVKDLGSFIGQDWWSLGQVETHDGAAHVAEEDG